jgi:4-diphosphocytidyl-2C-methyl-D-erythritol kinase
VRVVPKKQLGQHFLVDENILGVIGRLAELGPTDIVLEIGPGLGVLTAYLADRVEHVHAVELDRSLEPELSARLAGKGNVEVHYGDALALDLAAVAPGARKLVANLPYNVATPILVESLDGLPEVEHWAVMVQREVGDRLFARPSTKAYGAVSVLVQLATERTGFHPVSRTVPSTAERRLGAGRFPANRASARLPPGQGSGRRSLRASPQDALELAGADRPRLAGGRDGCARGHRPRSSGSRRGARAERIRRADEGARLKRGAAPAKLNLALVVGPRRPDGKHELLTIYQRLALADRIVVEPAQHLSVEGFAADTLVRDALEALGAAAGTPRAFAATIQKRVPVAAGLGGGSSDAATALRLANELLDDPLPPDRLHELAAGLGADVPYFLEHGPQLGSGDGTSLEPIDLPQDYWVLLVLPRGARKAATADVYASFDARGGEEGFDERRRILREEVDSISRARDLARLPPNDLASSALADELRALGAFRADVTGAGPTVYGLFLHGPDAREAQSRLASRGRTWITAPAWYR